MPEGNVAVYQEYRGRVRINLKFQVHSHYYSSPKEKLNASLDFKSPYAHAPLWGEVAYIVAPLRKGKYKLNKAFKKQENETQINPDILSCKLQKI